MDMFRQPDALLEACDRIAPLVVKWVTRRSNPFTPPLVFIPLHKGADSFMSVEQFQKFYWPSLLKVIEGLSADGFVPYLFAEGAYGTRLETLAADLPKGKTVVEWRASRATCPCRCCNSVLPTKSRPTPGTSSTRWDRAGASSLMLGPLWTTPSPETWRR
jgi:hypothetical protein